MPLDSHELRLLLDARIGGPGQYDGRDDRPDRLYLPLAGSECRLVLTFQDERIVALEPGPAFDPVEWGRIDTEIEDCLLRGPQKVGRDYSFSSFRVLGSWHGAASGVQILPPPDDAPRAPIEIAEHPFILEFPLITAELWSITNHRRLREHRRLTLLLNLLLAGRTSLQPRRPGHFWAAVNGGEGPPEIKWVQEFFFAKLGEAVLDAPSPPSETALGQVDPAEYYESVGHDGQAMRLPSDLDESLSRYQRLSKADRTKFDRCAFWMDMASREWTVSLSSSFAALVSAVESLTDRGEVHLVFCGRCQCQCPHEVPGATERFRAFFERYAPGQGLRRRRSEMYSLRSGILHGSDLMQLDQGLSFGWDPPGWNERELHDELWRLTRLAVRNWLRQA